MHRRITFRIPEDVAIARELVVTRRLSLVPADPHWPARLVGLVDHGHLAGLLDVIRACGEPAQLEGFAHPGEALRLIGMDPRSLLHSRRLWPGRPDLRLIR